MAAAGPGEAVTKALDAANAVQSQGRDGDAIALFHQVLALAPGHPVALNNLGVAEFRLGRPQIAEAHWRAALASAPDYPDANANLASILRQKGDLRGALEVLRRAVPGRARNWNDLGAAFQLAGDSATGIACLRTARDADPTLPEIHNNLGAALQAAGQRDEAIAACRTAIALRPNYAEAWVNLGTAYGAADPDQAIACARAGVLAAPLNADAHHNLGLALLATGNYAEGWAEYAWWEHTPQAATERRRFDAPLWDGKPTEGTVLLHCQQGYGDAIQFVRYARRLSVRVVIEAPAALVPLFSTLVETIPRGAPLPDYVAQCPLHILPLITGTKPSPLPYLHADTNRFRERLAALPGRKVGLCWAGNPALGQRGGSPVDARRSLSRRAFDMLADLDGISFISLQRGAPPDPEARLQLHDWTAWFTDFAVTAGLIAGLDLVITVDTAIAHLAGALGKPVWLLNRFDSDWRWGLGRENCDWYLALRQFRQDRPGDWANVMERVRDALAPPDYRDLIAAAETMRTQGEPLAAARLYRRIVSLRPDVPGVQNNLGLALLNEGNLPGAEAAFRAGLSASPDNVALLVNLGLLRVRRGDPAEAEPLYRRALALEPTEPAALGNLAFLMATDGRGAEAVALYDAAGTPEAELDAAITLTQLQRPTESIPRLRRLVAASPNNAAAHFALAEALLLDGQYRDGWRAYTWRRHIATRQPRALDIPLWDGRGAPGKTLLVQAEQGMGDTIQFARFIALAATRARVIAHVPATLCRLIATVHGVSAVVPREGPAPVADLRCDLLDLPHLLGIRRATLPARVPYLRPDPAQAAFWRDRLAVLPGRKIGLVWAGNPMLASTGGANLDSRRSIPPALLQPLGALAGLSFVSLQAGPHMVPDLDLTDWTRELTDFADTAALISGVDIVIGVDTAVTHLAAALGKTTFLLNRFDTDWRWGIGTADTPWYPTLTQFRQPRWGDWASVIALVFKALEAIK